MAPSALQDVLLQEPWVNLTYMYISVKNIRECGSTLCVGMPRKQNGRPIHCNCIVKSSPQNAAIGKF